MITHKSSLARVGVMGATGYTGLEVLRILQRHPGVHVVFATSEGSAGAPSGLAGLTLVSGASAPLDDVDLVFLCLPHGEAVDWAERSHRAGARVVDLTADHRPGSGRDDGWVYGLADWTPGAVAEAPLVANPGCYPTGVQIALLPLARAGLLEPGKPVVINAASGVTGAGRTPKRELLFAEVAGDYRAYSTGNGHRHLLEMRAGLPELELLFQPHLLPVARGILETIYAPVATGVEASAVRSCWRATFGSSKTVTVTEGAPALSEVVGTDRLVLGASDNAGVPGLVTVMASFDNLGMGAAGQAVHNMNLMLGQDPTCGLRL
ncbi:MAG TPA: N-acetyl-gamma-glutamyl-phosphate reductase [Longimicrobiales bacterium]|nr:N-acetyl-gamma-glutamyl-phosphate reductase [Longimicrobiales bacterium]